MRRLLLALTISAALSVLPASAQQLAFYIDTSNGASPVTQVLPLTYAFPDTPVGQASSVVIRVVNTGTVQASLDVIYVGAASGSPTANPNFSVTGFQNSSVIAPGSFKLFTVNFTPAGMGTSYGYLQGAAGGTSYAISTLQGNGLTPQITLSCQSSLATQCTGRTLQPNSASIIDFGTSLTTASLSIPFKLTNSSSSAINPKTLLSIATTTNNPNSAFSLSSLPATLAGGSSLDFQLIFAPGAALTYTTNLLVGTSAYPIQASGTASVVGDIGSLVISYTDALGVRLPAQPNSPVAFGSAVVGANSTTFTFTVANPATTIDPVSLNTLSVTGAGFTLAAAPSLPASVAPGASTAFKVIFTPSATGSYTGVLSVGTRQFNLTGQGTVSAVPDPSFTLDVNPLVSQKQAHLTVALASASPVTLTGTLTMTFTPSVDLVKDDPAIFFVATSGRQLGVAVTKGSQAVTINGQSSATFQTGTTAGTLKLKLEFPDGGSYERSYPIAPATIQIASATATAQSPFLVVNMTGYDNTYTAGKMSFTFYDSTGAALMANPVAVDATNDFKAFFTSATNATGSAFALQLKFPVTGDITKITNMGITVTNSAGTANVSQAK